MLDGDQAGSWADRLPDDTRESLRALRDRAHQYVEVALEETDGVHATLGLVRGVRFDGVPTVVIGGGGPWLRLPRLRERWWESLHLLAELGTGVTVIDATNAGHFVHLDAPDVVVRVICDVVERSRARRRPETGALA